MAYQALLFCPDEKTARTVTQVLSELDFQVSPCTEPFAAVKKLMAERFDAVVVDCDNEQNATLLFKSARNAPNNSSALAVAVVEGQAGVAKAFRIGANLVLTKPINVEQAKGTLRVARGLLRKNESSKTAPAPVTSTRPPSAAPEPSKIPSPPATISARPNFSAPAPAAAASAPAPNSSTPANLSAQVSETRSEDEILSPAPLPEIVSPSIQTSAAASTVPVIETPVDAKPEPAVSKAQPGALSNVNPSGAAQGGAASAPARALQSKPIAPSVKPVPETSKEKVESAAKVETSANAAPEKAEVTAPAPISGVVEGEAKTSGGAKKALIAVAAILLIAVASYWAWTQFGGGHASPASSVQPVQHPIPASSAVTPSTVGPSNTSPAISAAVPSSTSSTPAASEETNESSNVIKTSRASSDHAKESPQTRSDAGSASASKVAPAKVSDESAETVHPIIVKGGTEAVRSAKLQTDAPAPEIAGIATTQSGAGLSNLVESNTEPAPVLQAMKVSQGVSQGLIIKKVSPAYPANAARLGIEGQVELLATVSKKGNISAVKVLSGDPNLSLAAVEAVKQWKYKPYLLDGAPVEIQTQITVNFKLPR
jgi:protein TonB